MTLRNKLFCLFSIGFLSCNKHTETTKPELTGITESIYASGTVKSVNQYQAYATVNGIIKEVFVAEGDAVIKGTPILYIGNEAQRLNQQNSALAAQFSDVATHREKLNDARRSIDLAAHKLKNDSLLFSRQSLLWQQDIGTKVDLEQRELAWQNSGNLYKAAIVAYEELQRQINFNAAQSRNNLAISSRLAEDYTLRSEIDGVIYELPVKKGEIVGLQTPLALIGDARRFLLELQVDEYDIIRVKKGMMVLVTMDSYKGQVFQAIISRINPLMNERSRTFLVEADFTKGPPRLYPNMTLEANIIIQSKKNTLVIPRKFMLNDSNVVKSNGDKVVVKTGLKDYQKIEIISGLNAADELKMPAK